MTRGILFDLDDTLYLERDYVRSGFNQVARLAASAGVDAGAVAGWLTRQFEAGTRGDTFDRLLIAFPEIRERFATADLVAAYREHTPTISLLPDTAEVVTNLAAAGLRLGILSDGPLTSQQAKVTALGLSKWFEPIVLTAAHPTFGKPATAGFEAVAGRWGLAGPELAYVGDNPRKDFAGPRQLGWRTVRLRTEGQVTSAFEPQDDGQRADVEVPDLASAARYLAGQ